MRAAQWVVATAVGFALTGVGLHSPGASGIGNTYLDWDVSAAVFGAVLGAMAGAFTGLLQLLALRSREVRVLVATVVAVSFGHLLADGAPGVWGVPLVASLSGIVAGLAHAWAIRERDVRLIVGVAVAWSAGWLGGVALAGMFSLSGGGDPATWASEHAVIGGVLGLAFGTATSPTMRRILRSERALSSAG
ncbi:MAG TPA: hypothetical protein VM052_05250 [Candidatus Limnocylindrales bacterium]|nr:hypothetical protein [Candidatus Limnocylindrales bacterium]